VFGDSRLVKSGPKGIDGLAKWQFIRRMQRRTNLEICGYAGVESSLRE
jgi:hypothetical protein